MVDVSGTWTGTYWRAGQPTRFEATLVQGGNALSGRILDDAEAGEAQINGQLSGRSIGFLKRYIRGSSTPIRYSGTVSSEGDYMSGQWAIQGFDTGNWEAHRQVDSLMQELRQTQAKQQEKQLAVPAGKP